MSAMAELDAIRSGLITHIYLDITGWTRTPEVVDYALARGITVEAAVGELVNSGLSHLWVESSNAYVPDYSGDLEPLDATKIINNQMFDRPPYPKSSPDTTIKALQDLRGRIRNNDGNPTKVPISARDRDDERINELGRILDDLLWMHIDAEAVKRPCGVWPCVCGAPKTPGVTHRTGGPCYHDEEAE